MSGRVLHVPLSSSEKLLEHRSIAGTHRCVCNETRYDYIDRISIREGTIWQCDCGQQWKFVISNPVGIYYGIRTPKLFHRVTYWNRMTCRGTG